MEKNELKVVQNRRKWLAIDGERGQLYENPSETAVMRFADEYCKRTGKKLVKAEPKQEEPKPAEKVEKPKKATTA